MSKPSQYSLIHSTHQLPFCSSSSTHLFIPNSINSCHSHQTSQTLHLKNILFSFLSTSDTPCLCSLLCTKLLVQVILQIDISLCLSPSSIARILFNTPRAFYPSFIRRTTSLSHRPSATTCDPRYLNQSTFSNGSPFTLTCIRPPISIPRATHNLPLTYIHSHLSSFAYSTKLTHQSIQYFLCISHECCIICK